jgi:hypothetical protein
MLIQKTAILLFLITGGKLAVGKKDISAFLGVVGSRIFFGSERYAQN